MQAMFLDVLESVPPAEWTMHFGMPVVPDENRM